MRTSDSDLLMGRRRRRRRLGEYKAVVVGNRGRVLKLLGFEDANNNKTRDSISSSQGWRRRPFIPC